MRRFASLVLFSVLTACGSRSALLDVYVGDAGPVSDAGTSGHVLIFGGAQSHEDAPELADTWLWDGATWTQAHPQKSPQACDSFAMTGLGGNALMVGGYKMGVLYHETWLWNGVTYTEKTPANSPPHRFLAALAPSGSDALLFGGKDLNFLSLGDTWRFDGSAWTELALPSAPPARLGHAMAELGSTVVLFGGVNDNLTELNDTWVWDGTSWSQKSPPVSPPPRSLHAMATLGSTVVLFGGNGFDAQGNSKLFGDTWTWDGQTWTEQHPTVSPPARDYVTMATLNGRVVLFGGLVSPSANQYAAQNDTWTWDGSNWTAEHPVTSPPARFAHGSATVR